MLTRAALGTDEVNRALHLLQKAKIMRLKLEELDDWRQSEPVTSLKKFINELVQTFHSENIEEF